jgi:nitrite reductase/ring-hydroxylating ferredoxin subunit
MRAERLTKAQAPASIAHNVPVDQGAFMLDVVVVKSKDETMRAFENFCPHAGGKMGISADGTLSCKSHGAKFKHEDGLCVSGPCQGERLVPLTLSQCEETGALSYTDEALAAFLEGSRLARFMQGSKR